MISPDFSSEDFASTGAAASNKNRKERIFTKLTHKIINCGGLYT
jgi:hypothetical protein